MPVIDNVKQNYRQQKTMQFSANSLCQHVNKLFKKCNFKHVTSHSARKTYITTLANKSINVKAIMVLARHKNLATTQRYIEINDEQLKEANELIGKEN